MPWTLSSRSAAAGRGLFWEGNGPDFRLVNYYNLPRIYGLELLITNNNRDLENLWPIDGLELLITNNGDISSKMYGQ